MPTTPNLGLTNVLESENFNIAMYNGNNDKIDSFACKQPKKTTLYDNAIGTSSTVPLNDSAANFDYVLISFTDNDGFTHADTPCFNGKKALLSTIFVSSERSEAYAKSAVVNVSGTSIKFEGNSEMKFPSGVMTGTVPIKIIKVTGVKGF